ncbi:MAG: hypothetical protein IJD16_05075 [Desulfovibrio sp.]|nr:hypothetical protein [Desulfovibrio sp.]
MKKKIQFSLTVEDIRRANDQVMGKIPSRHLSDDDRALLARIKQLCGPLQDGPRLRALYREAVGR